MATLVLWRRGVWKLTRLLWISSLMGVGRFLIPVTSSKSSSTSSSESSEELPSTAGTISHCSSSTMDNPSKLSTRESEGEEGSSARVLLSNRGTTKVETEAGVVDCLLLSISLRRGVSNFFLFTAITWAKISSISSVLISPCLIFLLEEGVATEEVTVEGVERDSLFSGILWWVCSFLILMLLLLLLASWNTLKLTLRGVAIVLIRDSRFFSPRDVPTVESSEKEWLLTNWDFPFPFPFTKEEEEEGVVEPVGLVVDTDAVDADETIVGFL